MVSETRILIVFHAYLVITDCIMCDKERNFKILHERAKKHGHFCIERFMG